MASAQKVDHVQSKSSLVSQSHLVMSVSKHSQGGITSKR
jgi:hypothetical protein